MILRQHRCIHCHARYTYQASGWDAAEFNDDQYCPKCKEAIVIALKAIPPVCEHGWMPTNDMTTQTLVDIENERWEQTKAEGRLPVRRVLAPLFDLGDPSNSHHNGIVRLYDTTYRYEYWSKWGVEKGHVFIECEVMDGEVIGPWSMTDYWNTQPTFCEHEPWPKSEPTHEFVVKPFDMSKLEFPRFDIIEREHGIVSLEGEEERFFGELVGVGHRGGLITEPIPKGTLPIYDKDTEDK